MKLCKSQCILIEEEGMIQPDEIYNAIDSVYIEEEIELYLASI